MDPRETLAPNATRSHPNLRPNFLKLPLLPIADLLEVRRRSYRIGIAGLFGDLQAPGFYPFRSIRALAGGVIRWALQAIATAARQVSPLAGRACVDTGRGGTVPSVVHDLDRMVRRHRG